MKKYFSASAFIIITSSGVMAQNYNTGPSHVNGAVYDASSTSGSQLAANSHLFIGNGGTWLLNSAQFSTPRTGNLQTEVVKFRGGTYSRTSGFINGYAYADNQAAGFVLPIGHGSYMPLTINSALASGNGITAAWYDNKPQATTHIGGTLYYFLPGYYDLYTSGTGISVTASVPPSAIAGTRLIGTVDGVSFVDLGPANTTATAPSGNYQLRFANSSTTLPITLTAFTATKQGTSSFLSWHITSEQNIQSYTVERSAEGTQFTAIRSVPSQGNTSQERIYTISDEAPLRGTNHYRLKVMEEGGKHSYSPVRRLTFDGFIRPGFYPNPVQNGVTITGLNDGMTVSIVNLQGQQMVSRKASGNTEHISLNHLPATVYHLQILDMAGKLVASYPIVKE